MNYALIKSMMWPVVIYDLAVVMTLMTAWTMLGKADELLGGPKSDLFQ